MFKHASYKYLLGFGVLGIKSSTKLRDTLGQTKDDSKPFFALELNFFYRMHVCIYIYIFILLSQLLLCCI